MNEALYLHLRDLETPLERLIRERTQMFSHWHQYELNKWEARAKAEIRAMTVARTQGIGQVARHLRVKLMARHDNIPHPYDPDYRRVIQIVNARYVAALLDRL